MNISSPIRRSFADHVVLIGGGSTNALTAVRLAERGFRVTILEKAKIGNGSSSRSAAGIRAQFSVEETVVGMQYSEWWYTQFHEILQTPSDRRQPIIQQNGYLFLFEDPEQAAPAWKPGIRSAVAQSWKLAQENVAMQQRVGLPVEILTPQQVHERWPHIEPDRLVGATWCPTDGFLYPQMIYMEGFRRAQELGAHLMQDTEVVGATIRGGRIVALETTKGVVEADWFVNGTNAWARRLSKYIGGMPLPISPLKRYHYFLQPDKPIMSREEWLHLPMTIYGTGVGRGAHSRPENELLMLAWAHETMPEPNFSDEDQDRIDPPFNHSNGIDNYGYAIVEQMMDFAPASLLGSMLLGKLAATIFSRNEYGKQYPRVHIYIDEYARFSIPIISQLWTNARKFNCGMTATLQTLSQIKDEENRAAILQAGNLIAFQCIGSDAEILAKQMPLPDPVALMKPEPILLYSQTPFEDIWHKGHPNSSIMEYRKQYFHIVEAVEREPRQDYYLFDPTAALQEHPDWQIFKDWGAYRSSRSMLIEGITLLNQYFSNWMQHHYSLSKEADAEEVALILKIVECVSGYLGMRPVMQPFVKKETWEYLLHEMSEHTKNRAEKDIWQYAQDKATYNYRSVVSPRDLDYMRHKLEEAGAFTPITSDQIGNAWLASEVDAWKKVLMEDMQVPPYQIDQVLQWQVRPLWGPQPECLTEFVQTTLSVDAWSMEKAKERYDAASQKYHALMYMFMFLEFVRETYEKFFGHIREYEQRYPKEVELIQTRCFLQMKQLANLLLALRYTGNILEKEPVFDTSHSYKDVEWNRRTYSDLREELVTKLVSLPPYQAIIHLAGDGAQLPRQILTPSPIQIPADIEPKAKEIRERSQKELGHPWQEVVRDIADRQNLPPGKPQI